MLRTASNLHTMKSHKEFNSFSDARDKVLPHPVEQKQLESQANLVIQFTSRLV
jgi:hypothetical protein